MLTLQAVIQVPVFGQHERILAHRASWCEDVQGLPLHAPCLLLECV